MFQSGALSGIVPFEEGTLQAGAVIGSYQIVRKLGSGGMGAVYLGQHTLLGRRAAIKVLLPSLSAQQDVVRRFFNEARAVTSISDPGIVQVFDFGHHSDGSAFLVMEFLEGETLDRRLARLGRLPVAAVLQMCQQIAGSLAAAHAQRIIHRDLKPENIFLVRDNGMASGERPKILDFGIAKLSNDHPGKSETHTGMLMGTPRYMSPEQCRGLAEIDHRSDIYSLGCVMFHLLTGRPPFEGEGVGDIIAAHIREPAVAPSSLVAGIPSIVDALVLRCLAKAPADRFPSMTELAAAIGRIAAHVPVEAAPLHGPGTEAGAPGNGPQTYHPRQASVPSSNLTMPLAPTTLGASTGHLVRASSRSPRIGRWIAVLLVFIAVGVGSAILWTPTHRATRVAVTSHGEDAGADHAAVAAAVGALDAGAAADPTASAPVPAADMPEIEMDHAVPGDAEEPAPAVAPPPVAALEPAKKPAPPPVPPPPSKPTPSPAVSPKPTPPAVSPKATTSTRPAATVPPARTSLSSSPAPKKCSRAAFAAVYNAPAPTQSAVSAALRSLNACHEAGAVTNDEFERYQAALIKKH